jgi:hypothetical protein
MVLLKLSVPFKFRDLRPAWPFYLKPHAIFASFSNVIAACRSCLSLYRIFRYPERNRDIYGCPLELNLSAKMFFGFLVIFFASFNLEMNCGMAR